MKKIIRTEKLDHLMYEKIYVRPDDPLEMSQGGILIPQTSGMADRKTGVVVAVGEGRWFYGAQQIQPLHVKVGDHVRYKDVMYDEVAHPQFGRVLLMVEGNIDEVFTVTEEEIEVADE